MNKRQLAVAALGIAVAVAGAGLLVAQFLPADDRIQVVAESSASATPTPPASAGATSTAEPSRSATDDPSPTQPPAGTDATAAPGSDADGDAEVTPRTSTEVLPAEPGPVTLPPSKPRTALVSLPLPDSASSLGEVVGGFPSAVLPGIPDSLVESSSVASQGDRLQATLEGRSTLGTEDILAFYRQHFAPLGLLENPAGSSKRSTSLSFARGDDAVTLSITSVAGGSTYVLFGTFTAQD